MAKEWLGNVPEMDDFGKLISDTFVDGKTVHGPWAIMSPITHECYGLGLGTGRGQKYVKNGSRWLKVEG